MKKVLVIICIVFGFTFSITAQKTLIYVDNSAEFDNAIELRIFTNDLKNKQGINIFRKTNSSNWIKINQSPIRQKTLDEVGSDYDENTKKLIELLNSDENINEGIIKLVLILKIIQNKELANVMGLRYIDKNIEAGQSYTYKLINATSSQEMIVASAFTASKYKSHTPPDSISVEQINNKNIVFGWLNNTYEFYGVNIYKSINNKEKTKLNSDPILISKIVNEKGIKEYPKIKFTDEELKLGNNYKYQIEALDYFGNKGELSAVFEIDFKDIEPPPKPKSIHPIVNDKTQTVDLLWKMKGATDIMGYNIYLRTDKDSNTTKINNQILSADSNKYHFSVIETGNHLISVEAIDSAGNTTISDESSFKLLDLSPPEKPINLHYSFGEKGKIIFSWDKTEATDFMSYRIYRKESKAKHFTLMNAHSIDSAYFEDKLPLTVKNSFLYYVVALDTSYNTSDKSDLLIVKLPDITAPSKPFIKQAFHDKKGISIKWIANTEEDLAGYNLYLIINKDTAKINTKLILGTKYNDNNSYKSQTLSYILTAIDSNANESLFSNSFSLKTLNSILADGTFKKIKLNYKKANKEINISWNYNGKNTPMGYIVYVSFDDAKMKPITAIIKESSLRVSALKSGTYKYRITAFYSNGEKVKSDIKKIIIKH